MDALTLGLIVVGALLLAASIVGLVVLAQPTRATPESAQPTTPTEVALQPDQVATVLRTENGAAGAARVGDRVDVLGYFSRQVTGDENVTRVLVADVPVLAVTRDGSGASLTLGVPQATALLLHEAQALGAKQFVVLRSSDSVLKYPPSLSDSELATRLVSDTSGR